MRMHRHFVPLVLSFALALAGCAGKALQSAASADAVGISGERLKEMTAAYQAGVDKAEIAGAVVLVARKGQVAYFEAVGFRDPETRAPMQRDAIFRIASMTKPVTTVAALMLMEQGKLGLDDPVSRYLPAFRDVMVGVEKADASGKTALTLEKPKREMTVRDLMLHTSGLTYGFFGKSMVKDRYNAAGMQNPAQTNEEFAMKLAKAPLQNQPGTTWDYSLSTDLLGRVIEVVAGTDLGTHFAERIFNLVQSPSLSKA